MAWRLAGIVKRGEIDNRVRDRVEGRIWLVGGKQPLMLQLEGNCLRDIAGTLLTFENPAPDAGDECGDLYPEQTGIVGDMSASRKVRVFDVPVAEAYAMLKLGVRPPEHMANAVYLEWYSERNGRVVIESTDYTVTVSEPAWTMTEAEERGQREANAKAIGVWLERLTQAASAAERRADIERARGADADGHDADEPLDEFGWERFLRESDARTEQLGQLEDKYAGLSPEVRKRAIAREMGWTVIEEYLEAQDRGEVPENDVDAFADIEEEPRPNPAREGIDWVRDDSGRPVHPLCKQAAEVHQTMWQDCKHAGVLEDNALPALHDMLFCGQQLAAKLAGALNSVWTSRPPEPGFIVAQLKRALVFFNEAMAHWQTVLEADMLDNERMHRYREALFAVRKEMLRLMKHYRELDGRG